MVVWLGLIAYVFILRLFFDKLDQRKNKWFLLLCGIGIVFVMGSRYPYYEITYDLQVYYDYFALTRTTHWSELFTISRFEPGYAILNKLVAQIFPWDQTILYVEAIICVCCTFYFIYKNTSDVLSGVLVYITLGSMVFHLTAFRQAIAISICLIGVELIKKRKFWFFVLLVILASTMHKTAIVFLFAYFFVNRKVTLKNYVISLFGMGVLIFLAEKLTAIGTQIFDSEHGQETHENIGGIVPILIYLFVILMSLLFAKRLKEKAGLNLLIPGLALYILRYYALIIERISFFYTSGIVAALPEALNLESDLKTRRTIKLISYLLMILLFAYRVSYSDYGDYHFFWEEMYFGLVTI